MATGNPTTTPIPQPSTTPLSDYPYLARPDAARYDILAEQVHRICVGGNVSHDSNIDRRECRLAVEQAARAINAEVERVNLDRKQKDFVDRLKANKEVYFENLDALYKYGGNSDAFIRVYESWPVLSDTATGEYYSLLPDEFTGIARYQNVPSEEGVQSVEPMRLVDRTKRRYRSLLAQQARAMLGRYPNYLQGNYGYSREGNRVYYHYDPSVGQAPPPDKQVRLTVIIRPATDQLPPPGLLAAAQDVDIVGRAVALVMRKVAEDKTNDNNANTQ